MKGSYRPVPHSLAILSYEHGIVLYRGSYYTSERHKASIIEAGRTYIPLKPIISALWLLSKMLFRFIRRSLE